MAGRRTLVIDGNEAAASVAYRTSEVIAIYPITPASPMGEFADEWAAHGLPNTWGTVPDVTEMQSEAGAAGAVHGALQAGSLTTTFTASQGLLLMLPNLYKIGGELTSFCMHVAARTVATHALSIFGDHSDVMAARQCGLALLCSGSVQEAQDMACIGHAATLDARVPFIHFFDGFRTSHEVAKIEQLSDEDLRHMINLDLVKAHRQRALSPDHPVIRGTAQNPDVFFQAREACNLYYEKCPETVQSVMDHFANLTGRQYRLFDYAGHPEAERLIVLMGSGAETAHETVDHLVKKGEKVGIIKVRLFRPFSVRDFIDAIPKSVRSIAVLDRTKEPGAIGEPLYQDVVTALREAGRDLPVIGGRYGLSSKEFDPAMVVRVFEELEAKEPKNHFTIGITDDVTRTSLKYDAEMDIEADDVVRAVFFGLGADGTVGANKNSIKIIGEETENFAQGYFVYDSKKSGATTISHLRFGPRPIRSSYLVRRAGFVGCHQLNFLETFDVLESAAPGAVFLLNAPYEKEKVWTMLPKEVQEALIEKKIRFYAIDAYRVAREVGMGRRINTIMQTCFFAISGVLPREQAIAKIKEAIQKTYGKKGRELVERNFAAVDRTLDNLYKIPVPDKVTATRERPPLIAEGAPDFIRRVTAVMIAGKGDGLPVSAFPVDGTWPVGSSRWEKRNIALEIPEWDPKICVQCNKCALVCPHAAIRPKVYDPEHLSGAPEGFLATDYRAREWKGMKYSLQVAPEDCTGCTLCVEVCPAKDKANPRHKAVNMVPQAPIRDRERDNFAFFLDLPEADRTKVKLDYKHTQFFEPLFESSGACSGCGETPYIKLLTQLFGDRLLIANATGCSSIFGGNLPTTPYSANRDGRGPAWSNSLFEDNAEFGFGFRLSIDKQTEQARRLLQELAPKLGNGLAEGILDAAPVDEAAIAAQRGRIEALRKALSIVEGDAARRLELLADFLVDKSVWSVGGDGWAYDIGYGGLDHVLGTGRNVNLLVLDTEVYSNTGGQASKATPLGAAAKFAMRGKETSKKDLGMGAMSYGDVYVARIAFGAKDTQTLKALLEADAYPGTSLVIAYAHCIAHGYDMAHGLTQQKRAVDSGAWPLYRFDPRRFDLGEPPLVLDSGAPKIPLREYTRHEARFRMAEKLDPERFKVLLKRAQTEAAKRYSIYQQLAGIKIPKSDGEE